VEYSYSAKVTDGEFKGNTCFVVGEDTDVFDGKRWHEINGNSIIGKYAFRMGRALINAYRGRTFAVEIHGKKLLLHESEVELLDARSKVEDFGVFQ